MFDLTGKVAIVTGGGTGLGLRAVQALAEGGASVILASRKIEACQKAAESIRQQLSANATALQVDVRDPDSVQTLVKEVQSNFGTIDILVNSSGLNRDTLIDRATFEDWKEVIDTNLTGTFLCCRSVVPTMIKEMHGKIINIGSIYGVVGGVPALYEGLDNIWSGCSVAYSAAKGGVIQMTRTMAAYLARWGIQVNCISPGGMDLEQTDSSHEVLSEEFKRRYGSLCPMGRMGKGWEIKPLVAFLASDASSYVTGQNVMLDGGWTIW